MKRQFCLPCFLEIKKAGKHDIERVRGGANMKITCWRCKRRRFGAEYEISRKGGVSRDNGVSFEIQAHRKQGGVCECRQCDLH